MRNGILVGVSSIELPVTPAKFVKTPEGFPGTETNCRIGGFGIPVVMLNPFGKCTARTAPHIVPGPKHPKIWVMLVGRLVALTMLIV